MYLVEAPMIFHENQLDKVAKVDTQFDKKNNIDLSQIQRMIGISKRKVCSQVKINFHHLA
jgi:hypothetical protein